MIFPPNVCLQDCSTAANTFLRVFRSMGFGCVKTGERGTQKKDFGYLTGFLRELMSKVYWLLCLELVKSYSISYLEVKHNLQSKCPIFYGIKDAWVY
uniref:Uncharacterized protein n=1 Tax=Octopus bimaculoides TaxID=37653 RepID=A0A0L8HFB8_OCTBM